MPSSDSEHGGKHVYVYAYEQSARIVLGGMEFRSSDISTSASKREQAFSGVLRPVGDPIRSLVLWIPVSFVCFLHCGLHWGSLMGGPVYAREVTGMFMHQRPGHFVSGGLRASAIACARSYAWACARSYAWALDGGPSLYLPPDLRFHRSAALVHKS